MGLSSQALTLGQSATALAIPTYSNRCKSILGRIDPRNPIGGKQDKLDTGAAITAIDILERPCGLSTYDAAEAIIKVPTQNGGAIRLISPECYDPKQFALMPFGGGGALHSGAMMRDIGLGAAIVPRYQG